MTIVAVSFNKPEVNATWVEKESFNYEVWSDTDKTLAQHYGAAAGPGAVFPNRVTKVLDADGRLILEYVDQIDVGTHPQDVLEDCQKLFGTP